MMEYEAALEQILEPVPPAQAETVPVTQMHGRFMVEGLDAPRDLPDFDNSAVDGYAVKSADTQGATAGASISLRLRGRVPAGSVFEGTLGSGECVRIFTGSPLPEGADGVIMQEDTFTKAESPDTVWLRDRVKPWENIRFQGEDVKKGSPLLAPGYAAGAGLMGLLCAQGVTEVRVGRRPVVSLLAGGSELVEGGRPLPPGHLYESNRAMLAALIANAGAVPHVLPLVVDDRALLRQALTEAFAQSDAVITTGGVSVGELDFVKDAFADLGGQLDFWRVAIRPGRPFVFGRWGEKLLFGLPGNPVSALVTFLLLVRPALLRWQGAARTEVGLLGQWCRLAEPLENPGDRRHFMRVYVDRIGWARSSGMQVSHGLGALRWANGLVDVPPQTTLAKDQAVRVLRWD